MVHLANSLLQDKEMVNSESSQIDMEEMRPKATAKLDLLAQNRLGIPEAE